MEQDRHPPLAKFVEETVESMCMVSVTMAQDNRLNGTQIDPQHRQVVQCSIRRQSGIEKHCLTPSLVNNGISNETPCSARN